VLRPTIVDTQTGARTEGIVGNNFSSYVRDYDFSVVLPASNEGKATFGIPDGFGDLHGKLFKHFRVGRLPRQLQQGPVICISVSSSKTYHRTENHHPILGVEYRQGEFSPPTSTSTRWACRCATSCRRAASRRWRSTSGRPAGRLLEPGTDRHHQHDGAFQKIYRPEIYNANSVAGKVYQPSLKHQDYSSTRIVYDREERSQLAVKQGRFTEEHFIKPYRAVLEQWAAR
jgi:hypothetical protein